LDVSVKDINASVSYFTQKQANSTLIWKNKVLFSMNHSIKRKVQRPFLAIHKLGLKLGLQIIPNNYYSSVADICHLQNTKEIWTKKSHCPGVSYDLDEQATNVKRICLPYKNEYSGNKTYREAVSRHYGPGFGYIEAQALHSVIRHYKPNTVIEIGSGVSTYCSMAALELNENETNTKSELTCIEPFPSNELKNMQKIKLIPEEVQTTPIDVLTHLNKHDLLFIDSSHTTKPGSDVNYIILEILPRLQKGVIVHFHDIFLPYDYQRDVLQNFFQWGETSLLRAFLINNNKVKILFCLSQLHYDRRDRLKEVFPEYNPQLDKNGLIDGIYKPFEAISPHFPSSIYIQML
jgi:hypothetical protein